MNSLVVKCVKKVTDSTGKIEYHLLRDELGRERCYTSSTLNFLLKTGLIKISTSKLDSIEYKGLTGKVTINTSGITSEDIKAALYLLDCQERNEGNSVAYKTSHSSLIVGGEVLDPGYETLEQALKELGYEFWYFDYDGYGRYLITRPAEKKALEFRKEALEYIVSLWVDIYKDLDDKDASKIKAEEILKESGMSIEDCFRTLGTRDLNILYNSDLWVCDNHYRVYTET